MAKKIAAVLFLIILCVGVGLFFYQRRAEVVVSESVNGFIRPYAEELAREVNLKLVSKTGGKFTLYTANFEKGKPFPVNGKDFGRKILWLGSTRNYIPDLQNFDIVLASTPLLKNFLQTEDNAGKIYYLPLFADTLTILPRKGEFIAIIGNPPFVEDVLKEKHLPYFKYNLAESEHILEDMDKFQAAFIEGSAVNDTSIDVHPVIFTLAAQKIPLATYWSWPDKEEALNLFNDEINFYMDKDDAGRLVDNLLQTPLPADISERLQDARRLVKREYSLKNAVKKLSHIVLKEDTETLPAENSLNFDIPVSVGHMASGDFWLATDLSAYFHQKGWNTSLTYFNSLYKYKTAVNILVRGSSADISDMIGEANIYYLAYPQFGDEVSQKIIDDKERFYQENLQKLSKYDAVATASESFAKALSERGVKTHYISQFTDVKRFYPDYQADLKSEVLFVGTNAPYRRAAKIAAEHKLPVTIYGPHWGDMAKGEYVDNRVLRKYYSSAKIVLNDTRREMLVHGIISNRIFDATACGSLVISDYMPEIEAVYGDSVPMWKTEKELVALIKYYLDPAHEAERLEKAKRAQEITLKNFTAEQAARKFEAIIKEVKQNTKIN